MKGFRTLSLLAVSLCFAHPATAQVNKTIVKAGPIENSGINQITVGSGPIVANWKMKRVDGTANLTVNPDGTYLFSGSVKDKKKDRDFDISIALKSSLGGIVVFHYAGNDTGGLEWSKQGKSVILKENFKSFAGKVSWVGEWHTPLNKAGLTKRYEEREAERKKLEKEEAQARKKKDEKLIAEAKEKREKMDQEEVAESQKPSSGGGGSSIGSDIESAVSTVGSVVSTIGSVGSAIMGLF